MLALVIGVSITILVGYHILKGYAASGVLLAGGLVLLCVSAAVGNRILPPEVASTGNPLSDVIEFIRYLLVDRTAGLGLMIMLFGVLTLLGIVWPKVGFVGAGLVFLMTIGTLSFLVTTPECWVPDLGGPEHGFPLLSGAGRLVIKDVCILAGAVVVAADSAQRILDKRR